MSVKDQKEILQEIMQMISRIDFIHADDIPNISLYMDQVTTFMEEQLSSTRRYEDDKILTKTMINNYAKNKLLPSPEKKRYSRDHVLLLIFIYYFKNILSISDIQTLLSPVAEHYFQKGGKKDMTYIYEEVFRIIREHDEEFRREIMRSFEAAGESFCDAPEQDQDFLRSYTFICLLSFDIYMKKMIVEHLIDGMSFSDTDAGKERAEKKQKKKKGQD